MFIKKEKLHFSLTCSFYCCLVKETWALKVAEEFAVWGLVAFKRLFLKKCTQMCSSQQELRYIMANYMYLFLILA